MGRTAVQSFEYTVGIFDGKIVVDEVLANTSESFDRACVSRRRESVLGRIAVVSGLNDQGIALPTTTGITVPLADFVVEPRTPVHRDNANIVDIFNVDRYVSWSLKNLMRVVVTRRNWWNPMVSDTPIPVSAIQP